VSAPRLDPVAVPLQGVLLVEASAGTGKTWTMGALLLRFVLEEGLDLPGLLVLTFTEAATAELRERMRRRLEEALVALDEEARPEADPFLAALRSRLKAEDRWEDGEARRRLRLALASFDEASIFTIHGFCQRVITESPLALGLPPDLEPGGQAAAALREVALDALRRWWHRLPPGILDWLGGQRGGRRISLLDPEAWIRLAGMRDLHPLARLPEPPFASLEEACAAQEASAADHGLCAETALRHFREVGLDALVALLQDAGLHRGSYKPDKIPAELAAVREWLERGAPMGQGLLDGAKERLKYAAATLAGRVNKGGEAPRHPAFDALQDLQEAERRLVEGNARLLAHLQWECLALWPARAAALRLERRQLDFTDLLLQVRRGLQGEAGEVLARQLRRRWRAALVDEFQDTDPVQAEILQRIFGEGGLPLVLVGDPKQAIYGFRGADLDAYLAVARRWGPAQGLTVNWRSDGPLINALNLVFAGERFPGGRGPFLRPDIQARPVEVSGQADERALVLAGRELPPLLAFQAEDGPLSKARAEQLACRHLAELLRRLLRPSPHDTCGWISRRAGGALVPLQGREVAVLVRTNRQGQLVADALAQAGLACIQGGNRSIRESTEAVELERFLAALARPADTRAARVLLAGPLALALGSTPAEALGRGDLLERLQGELHRTGQEARQRGLASALAAMLERLGWPETLLGLRRGERRLVNWRHLLDLLCAEEVAGWSDPAELARRLAAPAEGATPPRDLELRLESEDNLVRVITQHKSKGLEFPLVCCPFLWCGEGPDEAFAAALLHDDEGARLAPRSGAAPPDEATTAAQADEVLGESLRLAYVALTRARSQLVVHSFSVQRARSRPGPLDWLLLAGRLAEGAVPGLAASWRELDHAGALPLWEAWEDLAARSAGDIGLESLEPSIALAEVPPPAGGEGAVELAPRDFHGRIAAGEQVSSFTSLITGAHADLRQDEWFGADPATAGEDLAEDLRATAPHGDWRAAFPRGREAGTCLHRLLELADFAVDGPGREEECRRELIAHGLDPALAAGTRRWLREVLEAPLDADGFRLARLEPDRRVAELEFHLRVDRLLEGGLEQLARRHGLLDAERLGVRDGETRRTLAQAAARPLRRLPAGWLKGYIDLCFQHDGRWWVLDWKSNHLGPAASSYTREAMVAEMARSGYFHQALLYLGALHRHLGRTLPGYEPTRHLGGLHYLFLRGVAPESPGTGVLSGELPLPLILELDAALGGRPCP
jgi:exodeoxyribonuclease V beta subunit